MTILLLAGSYPPETGGIARFMKSFVDGLGARGVEVDVASQIEMPRGYLRRVIAYRDLVLRRTGAKAFDRIVASSWSPFAVALPSTAGGRALPFDVFCHGMDLLEPSGSARYKYLMGRTLSRAERILANSRYTAGLALELGAREDRITILHPAVDPNRFTPGREASDSPVLLSVGRMVERKGFDAVIRTLPALLKVFPTLKYICVGDGPKAQDLRKLAQSLDVSASIEWAGEAGEDQLLRYYRSADVFVLPSRLDRPAGSVEGFGIVFLEASSCEVPVIGGNSGGVPDAIADGKTGYLVDPNNTDQLTDRILTLLSNRDLRKSMGQAGRRRVVAEFTEDRLAERYLSAVHSPP
jgi:phosphatidylinositol alpha-1,6-mannosyltransferase